MNEIHLPIQMQRIIRSALKAGVLHQKKEPLRVKLYPPLLCNIALHGIQDLWNQPVKYFSKSRGAIVNKKSDIVQRGVRYTDDMVFFLEKGENENELRNRVDQFLFERGLKVKEVKTHLVNSKEGFDFLGWRFEVINNYSLTWFHSKKNR